MRWQPKVSKVLSSKKVRKRSSKKYFKKCNGNPDPLPQKMTFLSQTGKGWKLSTGKSTKGLRIVLWKLMVGFLLSTNFELQITNFKKRETAMLSSFSGPNIKICRVYQSDEFKQANKHCPVPACHLMFAK